ncbi:MAG: hypothetical protein J6Z50_06085 [Fibrobacterales bacterium]|nr:hypothetical protein [Fibrobacterales bacterium]MBP5188683.1 hypothetical protein [Fibrobacterales bacterium]MBP5350483.1 hypothetical protein [Fibrobacterales bacterium]
MRNGKEFCGTAAGRIAALALCALLSGCGETGESEDEIARVGRSVLLLRDLELRAPADLRDARSREQKLQTVKNWVNDETLAQEARAKGLDKSPEFRLLVSDFERMVLADAIRREFRDSARFARHLDSLKLSIPIAIHPERIPADRAENRGTP